MPQRLARDAPMQETTYGPASPATASTVRSKVLSYRARCEPRRRWGVSRDAGTTSNANAASTTTDNDRRGMSNERFARCAATALPRVHATTTRAKVPTIHTDRNWYVDTAASAVALLAGTTTAAMATSARLAPAAAPALHPGRRRRPTTIRARSARSTSTTSHPVGEARWSSGSFPGTNLAIGGGTVPMISTTSSAPRRNPIESVRREPPRNQRISRPRFPSSAVTCWASGSDQATSPMASATPRCR